MSAKDFLYQLESNVPKEALDGHETNFHFELEGEGEFTVEVKDGKLQVSEGFHGEPKCTVRATSENFMKVVHGELNALNALLFGKVKVSNQGELMKYAKKFGLVRS